MLWVIRWKIRVNRAATGWLVKRFVDPSATFRFVDPVQVAEVERAEGAIGFDAPGARYPHKDWRGRCSFEALVEEHRPDDPALRELACIVHRADFPEEPQRLRSPAPRLRIGTFDVVSLVVNHSGVAANALPDAVGLRTISMGFPLVAKDDHETLKRSAFVYDALYASLGVRLGR